MERRQLGELLILQPGEAVEVQVNTPVFRMGLETLLRWLLDIAVG